MALLLPSSGEYQTEFYKAWLVGLDQVVDVFNQASMGTLTMAFKNYVGSYYKEAGYDRVANLISDRDVTTNAAVADLSMSLTEHVGVDKASKIGPVLETHENFNRRGVSVDEFAGTLGRQAAEDFMQKALDHAVATLIGVTSVDTAMSDDTDKASTTNYNHMLKGLRKFGDQTAAVKAILMSSEAFYDLAGDNINNYKIENVAGVTIAMGPVPGAMGRPIIVSDVAALTYDEGAGELRSRIFFLREGAVSVEQRGEVMITLDEEVQGLENLSMRMQGEYNYLLKALGYSWNIGAGGRNPSEAALATGANWTRIFPTKLTAASVVIADAAN